MPWIAVLLALFLTACGGGGGSPSGGGAPPPSQNAPPVFTSAASVSVAENRTGAFFTATASDPNGGQLSFSISGGADAARFSITSAGALSFVAPPDFESPADSDRDNIYQVGLAVSDGALSAAQTLVVTITDAPGALGIRRVATGFASPIFLTGKGDGRIFVVERGGRIRILDPATGAIAAQPFLDIATQISTDGERGLLGLALAPDFATSGRFYVHMTNPGGDIEIRRYQRASADAADPASGDVILRVPHASNNHNGGWIGFGPDGFLYIAMGDGGGQGPENGQNTNALLGKILRIDPRTDAFPADANRDYTIPPGNPFATSGGAPEVWVYGLRNPFRNSFDHETGNLYIADVGQGAWEEVSLARSVDGGRNYGWAILEGTHPFGPGSTAGLTPPVLEYPHGNGTFQGNSVTGGYVYRGPIASLRGEYFFGDFVNQRVWSVPAASLTQGQTITSFTDRKSQWPPDAGVIGNVASFGEDDAGNLYIVDFDGEIFVVTNRE